MIFSQFRTLAATDRIAVHDGRNTLTFAQLWQRSEAIAAYLLRTQPGKKPVAIYGDKENDMLTAMLGAVKSGHPYVTVPSFYPETRIRDILADCDACAVLNPAPSPIPVGDLPVLSAAEIDALAAADTPPVPESAYAQPGDIICILYTSGSTGKPKGVLIDYDNVVARIEHFGHQFKPVIESGSSRTMQLASYAFSASLPCVFGSMLYAGLTVYCVPKDILQDAAALVTRMLDVQPHFLAFTPSLADRLMADARFNAANIPSLRRVSFAGEALSFRAVRALRARFPQLTVTNSFGSTEATACPFWCEITDEMMTAGEGYCPIEPANSSRGYLADDNGMPLTSDDAVGEIVFNYPTVSRGYLNRPALTEEKFFTDSFGKRAYKTGDIGEIRGGYLYFRGRKDNQVKIGGNRIELEEVENHLRSIDIVANAACAVKTLDNGTNLLVGFIVLKPCDLTHTQAFLHIKKMMKARTESHMIPTKLVFLEKLPLNDNRKLNRLALADMVKEV